MNGGRYKERNGRKERWSELMREVEMEGKKEYKKGGMKIKIKIKIKGAAK